jgi:hypothetical protein
MLWVVLSSGRLPHSKRAIAITVVASALVAHAAAGAETPR